MSWYNTDLKIIMSMSIVSAYVARWLVEYLLSEHTHPRESDRDASNDQRLNLAIGFHILFDRRRLPALTSANYPGDGIHTCSRWPVVGTEGAATCGFKWHSEG